jgi:2-keto-3-deoxy-L-rhamnonate aldolase RhmA
MPRHDLRRRILAGERLFGIFLNTGSVMNAEICARAGFDWVLIDLEHGVADESDVLSHLHAVQSGTAAALVRVEGSNRMRIARTLDLGAEGIMVPRVASASQAQEIVGYLRFPPDGVRGIALFTRGAELGQVGHGSVSEINHSTVGIVQIESAPSVEAAGEIAAVDGADVLFVGPTDLSHALGIPGQLDHPAYEDAVRRVGQAARDHGKAAGVLLWRSADLDRYVDAGFTFFGMSSDGALLDAAVRSSLSELRARSA